MEQHAPVAVVRVHGLGGQVRDIAVGDRDALRYPRRTRREHRVDGLVGVDGVRRSGGGKVAEVGGGAQDDDLRVGVQDDLVVRQGLVGEQDRCPGVGEDLDEPAVGVGGVQRGVHGPGLDHGEQSGEQVGRALHQDGDHVVLPDPEVDEVVGQPVGDLVEFGERQVVVLVHQGYGVRGAGGLRGEQLRQALPGRAGGGAAPLLQEQPPLVLAEQVEDGQRGVGRGDHGLQQPVQPRHERLDRPGVVEIGGVLDGDVQAVRPAVAGAVLGEAERQVELGDLQGAVLGTGVEPREPDDVRTGFAHGEHHLEERVAGGGALGVQHLDQPVEGQVLVVPGGQIRSADPGQQFTEAGVARDVRTQHQGVDEEADQSVECFVDAPRHRGADRYVEAGAGAREGGRDGGLHRHEQRGAGLPCEVRQPGMDVGGQAGVAGGAHVRGRGRARTVGRQRPLLRQVRQRLLPEVQLP
ncbi:hypothetical protein EES39_39905 [Streptomyces sp. ADI92-24]|nr:hypothetical protein EES39_39905 [Streptomyces sp. ADI92-24]